MVMELLNNIHILVKNQEINLKAIGKMERNLVKELNHGPMEPSLMEITKMIRNMVRGN